MAQLTEEQRSAIRNQAHVNVCAFLTARFGAIHQSILGNVSAEAERIREDLIKVSTALYRVLLPIEEETLLKVDTGLWGTGAKVVEIQTSSDGEHWTPVKLFDPVCEAEAEHPQGATPE